MKNLIIFAILSLGFTVSLFAGNGKQVIVSSNGNVISFPTNAVFVDTVHYKGQTMIVSLDGSGSGTITIVEKEGMPVWGVPLLIVLVLISFLSSWHFVRKKS